MKHLVIILVALALLLPTHTRAQGLSCARNVVIYFDASYSMIRSRVLIRMLERLEAVLRDENLIRSDDEVSLYVFTSVPVELDYVLDGRFIAGVKRSEALAKVNNLITKIQVISSEKQFEVVKNKIEELLNVDIVQSNDFSTIINNISKDIKQISSLSPVENLVIVFSDFVYDAPFDKYRREMKNVLASQGKGWSEQSLIKATRQQFSQAVEIENAKAMADLETATASFDITLKDTNYLFVMAKVAIPPNEETQGRIDVDATPVFKNLLDRNRWAEISPQTSVERFVADLWKQTRGRPTIVKDSIQFTKDNENNVYLEFKVKNPNCSVLTIDGISLLPIKSENGHEIYSGGTNKLDLKLQKFGSDIARVGIMNATQAAELLKRDDLGKAYSTRINLRIGGEYVTRFEAKDIVLPRDILSGTAKLAIRNAIYVRHLTIPILNIHPISDLVNVRFRAQASLPVPLKMKIVKPSLCGIPLTAVNDETTLSVPPQNNATEKVVTFKVGASGLDDDNLSQAVKDKDLLLNISWGAQKPAADYLPETNGTVSFTFKEDQIRDYSPLEFGLILFIFSVGLISRFIVKSFINKSR